METKNLTVYRLAALLTCIVGFIGAASAPAADAPSYQVTKIIKVGGEGRWDYCTVDPATHLLYVSRQTHVQVIDPAEGKVVADLPDTPGVHGIAIAREFNRVFTSNGQANTVSVFDLKTNKSLGTIPTGKNPDAIIYDPGSKRIVACNGRDGSVTVIDPAAEVGAAAAVATIPVEGRPEFAAADGKGRVYVNLEDKSSIAVIDTRNLKAVDTWKLEGGEEPSGLAIDPAHHLLFSGCGNQQLAIVDTESGKTVATIPIGRGVDACAFDPGTNNAFASCGDGTLTVVTVQGPNNFKGTTVGTHQGARTVGLDPTTHTLYLPTAEFQKPKPGERRPAMVPGTFMIVVVAPAK